MAAQNNTTTFTSEPPSYDNAVGGHPPPRRTAGNDTDSDSDDEDPLRDTDPEERMSMDDEYRDLPEGWVRAFDTKTMHHFYVDKKTKRSIWIHPYDDPEFLQSLPDSHPANPNSEQARAVRKASEDEMSRAQAKQQAKQQQTKEKRSFGGKIKDKLIGTKEERKAQKEREAKLLRDQQQAYIMRRKALIEQRNDPSLQRYYTSNPYSYAAPSMAFSRRGGYYGSPYGYGYGGGYGRRGYGMGMPLMGGLGGGLLLGSMMGGGMYGGGYGMGGMGDCGGGMGGGDMGGGGGGM